MNQPFQIALPCPAGTGIDAFCDLVEANINQATSRSVIEDGSRKVAEIQSADGTETLLVYLMSSADFANAAGKPWLFFANSGDVNADPVQCREVVDMYRMYQKEPDAEAKSQWLAGMGTGVQYLGDPSDPKAVQIQFVAAA